jgi:hypothetical protein
MTLEKIKMQHIIRTAIFFATILVALIGNGKPKILH